MGLFSPKLPKMYEPLLRNRLKQVAETSKLINTTLKPDVFFGRLNFLLDILMELSEFERYKVFSGELPSRAYLRVLNNLEFTVSDFIQRSYTNEISKISALKTEKAKENRIKKYFDTMESSFTNANSFWSGSISPSGAYNPKHYTGKLFRDANLRYLKSLKHKHGL